MDTGFDNAAQRMVGAILRSGLAAPRDIRFGTGALDAVGEAAAACAETGPVFLALGDRSAQRMKLPGRVSRLLRERGFRVAGSIRVAGEPTVADVNAAAARARRTRAKLVVAVGGGSVMDTGKAVAALAGNPGPVEDYLEGFGRNRSLSVDPLPLIAVPTTAGTGSEMTKNAVVCSYERGVKKSLRDPRMIPAIALLDPQLAVSVPPSVTVGSGLDAIAQLVESCISVKRRPGTTALALGALRWPRRALPRCVDRPQDLAARARMTMAAGTSGVCLANAGLAMAHGIAAALGALHQVPHGLACGLLLPHTLRYNRDACEEPLAEALAAFLNRRAPGPDTIDEGIAALEALHARLGVPPDLSHLLLSPGQVEKLARHSTGSSMSGNPVPLNDNPEELLGFLLGLC